MVLRVNKRSIKQFFVFLLPTLIIVLQNMTIGTIRISWLLSLILFMLVIFRFKRLSRNTVLLLMSIIVIVYPVISYLWSISTSFNIGLYLSLVTGLCLCLYICCIPEDIMKYFIDGCFFSCVLFTVWGIYEIITGNYLLFDNWEFIYVLNPFKLHYPGVAFPNTNDLAQYLAMLIPTVFLYEWEKNKYNIRMLLCATLIGAMFVIYNAYSHLGMISFVISLGIVISRLINHYLSNLQRFFVIILFGAIIIFESDMLSLIYNNLLHVSTENIHFTERASIYTDLLESIIKNPIGGFGNAYNVAVISPHNLFLYVLSDFGIINGVLFAVLLCVIAIKLFRAKGNPLCFGLLSALLTFPLTSSISSGNEQRKIIWLILGLEIHFAWKQSSDLDHKERRIDVVDFDLH